MAEGDEQAASRIRRVDYNLPLKLSTTGGARSAVGSNLQVAAAEWMAQREKTETAAERAFREAKAGVGATLSTAERAYYGHNLGLNAAAMTGIQSAVAGLAASVKPPNFLPEGIGPRLAGFEGIGSILGAGASLSASVGAQQVAALVNAQFKGALSSQVFGSQGAGAIAKAVADMAGLSNFTTSATGMAAIQAQIAAMSVGNRKMLSLQQEVARFTSRHASVTGSTAFQARLAALQVGYAQQLGGPGDAFGRLRSAVQSAPTLGPAVDHAMTVIEQRGGLGFNYSGVQDALVEVDEVLSDREVEHAVLEPLEEVQEVADLHDDLIVLPDLLGLARRLARIRPSALGLITSFTIGSTHMVLDYAGGASLPLPGLDAMVLGAGIYGSVVVWEATASKG